MMKPSLSTNKMLLEYARSQGIRVIRSASLLPNMRLFGLYFPWLKLIFIAKNAPIETLAHELGHHEDLKGWLRPWVGQIQLAFGKAHALEVAANTHAERLLGMFGNEAEVESYRRLMTVPTLEKRPETCTWRYRRKLAHALRSFQAANYEARRELPTFDAQALFPLTCRMVTDGGDKWTEIMFESPALLEGNAVSGFSDQDGYMFISLAWSEDLTSWSSGKFVPAPVPLVYDIDRDTYQYWSRAIDPQSSKPKMFARLGIDPGRRYGYTAPRYIDPLLTPPFQLLSVSATLSPRSLGSGTPTTAVELDRNITQVTLASVSDYQLRVATIGGDSETVVAYESLNPSIATVSVSGFVTHVANGSVTIQTTAGGQTIYTVLTMSTTASSTFKTFTSFVSGSLAEHVSTAIDSRIAGKSTSNALAIFTAQNHTAPSYTRNPNLWCADLPNVLTCLSPWNTSGGNTRAGTLISPRHILFAAHYQINAGATVRFVTADGTVVDRVMTSKLTHPDYAPYFPDLTVGVLDSDVPAGIAFARILPANYETYLPSLNVSNDGRIPTLTLDQEEKALVTDWYRESTSTSFTRPTDVKRVEFYESKISGDSGNPALIPVNGLPVLLTVWTYGGAGQGTSLRNFKTAVNTMMTTLGGGYQLTEIDLSSFPSYS